MHAQIIETIQLDLIHIVICCPFHAIYNTIQVPKQNLQALLDSYVYPTYPQLKDLPFGIYSKKKPLDYELKNHDRIEFYSPLIADPKQQRRKKAKQTTKK